MAHHYSDAHPGRPVPAALQVSIEEQHSMKIPESSIRAPTEDNSGSFASKRKRASSSDSRKRQK
ncbi:hypothetical protein FIBSPDRAFT_847256 [Athelia psychrophila]|uniref:Uncharacterized protein n=1 Tax=Athelia psychrophila TaxID=1759441 RepID=A0A166WUF1_9AGAM|nr:hypothetical protein FIBSPDRAFT_847256 [Fibularhizoctonia sp. CBS 109695]